jgi:hypothetical protein
MGRERDAVSTLNRKKERPTTSYAWAQRMIDGIKMNVGEVDMTMKFNGYRFVSPAASTVGPPTGGVC